MINSSVKTYTLSNVVKIDDDLKKKVILLKSGDVHHLYVETSIANNPAVMQFEKKLQEKGIKYDLFPITISGMEELVKDYVGHELSSNDDGLNVNEDDREDSEAAIKKAQSIFADAVERNASDIHIDIGSYCKTEYRIDGKIQLAGEREADEGLRSVRTIFNYMSADHSHGQYLMTKVCEARVEEKYLQHLGLTGARFSSRPSKDGVHVVMRLISARRQIVSMDQLGFLPKQKAALERALARPNGIIFFTGPMGSGKSTLAQIICEQVKRADPGIQIQTIESPIESPIEGVVQTALLPEETWGEALASTLRQDVNMLFFGEVRDNETALGVIEGVGSGHYILTSLHTPEAISALERLRGLGVAKDRLTNPGIIVCLVGQRLAPLLCPECKLPYHEARLHPEKSKHPLTDYNVKMIEAQCDLEHVFVTRKGGCPHCYNQGFKGRVGVYEVIETSTELFKRYIKEGEVAAYTWWLTSGAEGAISLCSATKELINNGRVDPIIANKDICNLDRDDFYKSI